MGRGLPSHPALLKLLMVLNLKMKRQDSSCNFKNCGAVPRYDHQVSPTRAPAAPRPRQDRWGMLALCSSAPGSGLALTGNDIATRGSARGLGELHSNVERHTEGKVKSETGKAGRWRVAVKKTPVIKKQTKKPPTRETFRDQKRNHD